MPNGWSRIAKWLKNDRIRSTFQSEEIFGSENVGNSLFSGSNSAWNFNYFEEIRANAHFQDFALILSLAAI